ncbi:MAG: carbohydrate-binding protein [Anaerolineaceae bacterium]|nr:carbohydrate-binding protein [Anaerolineaceae bacterium]
MSQTPTPTPTATNTVTPTAPACSYGPYDLSQNSRIEAENFRCGGESVGFHEDLAADTGPGSGDYRTDVSTAGPDLQTTTDVGGGYNLGWTRSGEWLEYEIIATQAGAYDVTLRYASATGNTPAARLTVEQGGTVIDDSGVLNLAATGDPQNWADYVVTLNLAQGNNILRLTIEAERGNFNYFDIQLVATPTPTATATATGPTVTPSVTASATSSPTATSTVTSGSVPQPWVNGDMGDVGAVGTASEAGGTFTVAGAGADIGGTADAFHYVYQPLAGDGSIVVRVASQTTPAYWSRAGVMMRESLAADSPHVMAAVMSRANRIQTFQRSTTGGTTTTYPSTPNDAAPIWLRLERVGSTIISSRSDDGVTWTQLESLSTTMSGTIYVGMAVTSYSYSTLSTAMFDNVVVTGGGATATPTATNTATPTHTPTATATANSTATPTNTPPSAGDLSGIVRYLSGTYIRWENVNVMLFDDSTSTLLSTTATDENGYYQFTQLPAGSYRVIACGYIGTEIYGGERITSTVPNPYLDVFANHETCPIEIEPPITPQTVTIYAAGTPGDDGIYPTMELRINDETVATFTDVQGDPGQRDFLAFTYTNNYWPVDVTTVKVAFVNDSGPRNLYVDKIVVGGVIYETEAPTTYSTGTYSSGTNCDADYKQNEGLHCNGYFQYGVRVQRTTYSIAGQAIGMRIVGNPDGGNGLYYMHTDHLGSTSTLSYLADDGTANIVADARAMYAPFGDYRLEPTGEYTDRGYTGHLGNNSGSNDIGLIYMNARFYVPTLNRWLSPDTIVPDPTNPQSFNRYSYVRNNPVNFTDPTGHRDTPFDGGGGGPPNNTNLILLPKDEAEEILESAEHGALSGASMLPYLDTGDDLATLFTGCSYACQAGYEEPVGWGWRAFAGASVFLPIGVSSARTAVGLVDDAGSALRRIAGYGDDLAGLPPVKPSILDDAVASFRPRTFSVNGEGFHLSQERMEHILARHHPNYWQGGTTVSHALDADISVDNVAGLVQSTIQNGYSSRVIRGNGSQVYIGTVNGNRYRVIVAGPGDATHAAGHIVQFTPLP